MTPINPRYQLENKMLQNMVQNQLTQVDKRAIAKLRGFADAELNIPALFENTFQTAMGLEQAFAELTSRELSFLHLLKMQSGDVNIAFFAKLYQQNNSKSYNLTFTQQYKDLFKLVREKLVRRGVIIWSEARNGNAQLERYRFLLPQAVCDNLPSLLPESIQLKQGSNLQEGFRRLLVDMLKRKQTKTEISLQDGQLLIGRIPFSLDTLRKWQDRNWQRSLLSKKDTPDFYERYSLQQMQEIQPPDVIRYALRQLPDQHWITPDMLATFFDLQFFYFTYPTLTEIFHKGWQSGCLERVEKSGQYYYRLREFTEQDIDGDNISYLSAKKSYVVVDVKKVPYAALSYLITIGDFGLEQGQLVLTPNLTKLSEISVSDRQHALLQWLVKNSPYFAKAYEQVMNEWGKLIVHSNLLYAQVRDLSLRVTLEKAFDDGQVVFLPEGWMAFPVNMLSKIGTVVSRSGHVIKGGSKS